MESKKAKLFVISGPSGVGKSTIVKAVVEKTGVPVSVSATTRPQGETEVDGKDYWFITKDEFQDRIANNQFLEYAEVFDNLYGTPRDKVQDMLQTGQSVILEIDTQGGLNVKKDFEEDAVMIFILPPTNSDLAQRMSKRGRESDKDSDIAKKRLANASNEIAMAWQHYEHMVINDVLENAVKEIVDIIKLETGESKK